MAAHNTRKGTDLVDDFINMLRFAKITPGRRLARSDIERMSDMSGALLERALCEATSLGLLREEGDFVVIVPLQAGAIHSHIDRRQSAEIRIAVEAARNISDHQIEELEAELAAQLLCAINGDIEQTIAADMRLEKIICDASGIQDAFAMLDAMKIEMRRTWVALHRTDVAAEASWLREPLVRAISARDAAAASAAVTAFYDHLRREYVAA